MFDTLCVDARREGIADTGGAEGQRCRAAVDREHHDVVDAALHLCVGPVVDDPAARGAVPDLDLVGGDIDAGKLEVGVALPVE